MSVDLGSAYGRVEIDTSGAQKSLGGLGTSMRSTGKMMAGALAGGALAAGAAMVAVGSKALSVQGDFKLATDALINGTGASGSALSGMQQSVENLKASSAGLGTNFETIGATMAEVNTRTGATGGQLETLTGQILEFTRLAGGDAVGNTKLLTRAMGDWGVQTDDAGQLLDQLHGAGQAFGIGFDSLSSKLVQFGAPLRQMGFSMEESIALFGKWEKEGVNTELAIGSLRIAAGKFASENIPLKDGLNDTIAAIKGAASESDALSIAMETFGQKAGPDMAAAIREGRFELDGAIEALQATEGGLADASERTIGFREKWAISMASMTNTLLPLGEKLAELAEASIPYIEQAVTWFVESAVPAMERFGEVVAQVIGFISGNFGTLDGQLATTTSMFDGIKTWIDTYMPELQETISTILEQIGIFWTAHGETIMAVVSNAFQIIGTTIGTTLQVVTGLIQAFFQLINGDFEGAFETLTGVVDSFWEGISSIFSTQLDSIKLIVTDFGGAFKDAGAALMTNMKDGVLAGFGNLKTAVTDKLSELKDLLPFSEPKDHSSPLYGLTKSGHSIIGQIQQGIDGASFNIDAPVAGMASASNSGSDQMTGSADSYRPINIEIHNHDVGVQASLSQQTEIGILRGLRAAGLA